MFICSRMSQRQSGKKKRPRGRLYTNAGLLLQKRLGSILHMTRVHDSGLRDTPERGWRRFRIREGISTALIELVHLPSKHPSVAACSNEPTAALFDQVIAWMERTPEFSDDPMAGFAAGAATLAELSTLSWGPTRPRVPQEDPDAALFAEAAAAVGHDAVASSSSGGGADGAALDARGPPGGPGDPVAS